MPCISGNFDLRVGPIVEVVVLKWDPIGDEPLMPGKLPRFSALIDTGATSTCVSRRVADGCGLEPTGKVPMYGATGEGEADQFTFAVGFILRNRYEPDHASLQLLPVQGCSFDSGAAGFDVLIGRDIICRGTFSMSFDGHFVLSV